MAFTYLVSGSQRDVSICKALDSLNAAVDILYAGAIFLSPSELQAFTKHVLRFGRHLQWLAKHSSEVAGDCGWIVKPKAHFWQHMPEQAALVNPRYVQCYLEEGLVGKVCEVYLSCANGPSNPAEMEATALTKYLIGLTLRFGGHGS